LPNALRERLKRIQPLRSQFRALQSGLTHVRRAVGLPLRPALVSRYLAKHEGRKS